MSIHISKLLPALFFLASTIAFATQCPTNTLDYYRLPSDPPYNGGGYTDGFGCTNGGLTYTNFAFRELIAPGNSAITGNIKATDIIVGPTSIPDPGLPSFGIPPTCAGCSGLDFFGATASVFNRLITVPERYFISYTVDPPPVVAGDELFLDPPTGPITVSKWGCRDDGFFTSASALTGLTVAQYSTAFQCLRAGNDPYFLQVTPPNLQEQIVFPTLAALVNVRIVIDLIPAPGCSPTNLSACTSVSGLEGIGGRVQTIVPEPAFVLPLAAGLAGLVLAVNRRRKTSAS